MPLPNISTKIVGWLRDHQVPDADLEHIQIVLSSFFISDNINKSLVEIQEIQASLLYYKVFYEEVAAKYERDADTQYKIAYNELRANDMMYRLTEAATSNRAAMNSSYSSLKPTADKYRLIANMFHELYLISLKRQGSLEQRSNNLRANLKSDIL